jgi:hypothetical protein
MADAVRGAAGAGVGQSVLKKCVTLPRFGLREGSPSFVLGPLSRGRWSDLLEMDSQTLEAAVPETQGG